MKRKLISQGGGGYTIYLPKKWVDAKGLKAGEQIEVSERGAGLAIDSSVREKKEISIKLDEGSRKDLKTILTHLYRRGFDRIVFTSAGAGEQREIKKSLGLLLGFELTEPGKDKCVVENITEPEGEKYQALLRRAFLIIKEAQRITLESAESREFRSIDEISALKDDHDRLVLFCRRTIAKEGTSLRHPVLEWELLTFLMHIMHAYKYLYSYAGKNRPRITARTIGLLKELEASFQLLYNAYYERDMAAIHRLNRKEYLEKCYSALEKSSGKETPLISHIREISRLVQVGSSPIISIILEESSL